MLVSHWPSAGMGAVTGDEGAGVGGDGSTATAVVASAHPTNTPNVSTTKTYTPRTLGMILFHPGGEHQQRPHEVLVVVLPGKMRLHDPLHTHRVEYPKRDQRPMKN